MMYFGLIRTRNFINNRELDEDELQQAFSECIDMKNNIATILQACYCQL